MCNHSVITSPDEHPLRRLGGWGGGGGVQGMGGDGGGNCFCGMDAVYVLHEAYHG